MFNGISDDWKALLEVDLEPILADIDFTTATPPKDKIFEFARLTPLDQINVVIIGQDPYPKKGDAHGLAFSCKNGIPASLQNIYKALVTTKIIKAIPYSGDLTSWAKQGILLINRALTTTIGVSNAHSQKWNTYTRNLICKISAIRPMVFILWGNPAKSIQPLLDKRNAYVLTWGHPSPLNTKEPFVECTNFLKCNEFLVSIGHKPINWDPCAQKIEEKVPANKPANENPADFTIFTDGCCSGNGTKSSKAAYATFVTDEATKKSTLFYSKLSDGATNIVAEGYAIYYAMLFLADKKWEVAQINTDSEFWINMFTNFMPSWQQNNTDFATKANPQLTIPMWKLYKELTSKRKIILFHVPSHDKKNWSTSPNAYERMCFTYNAYVDEMAQWAADQDIKQNVVYMKDVT